MRSMIFISLLMLTSIHSQAQIKDSLNWTYSDWVYVEELNGLKVFSSQLYELINNRIKPYRKNIPDDRYPKVYFTNASKTQYLKVWGAPDIGFNQFYSIGYTKNGKCKNCGQYIGVLDFPNFIIDHNIQLGDTIKKIWAEKHLVYFRSYTFNGDRTFFFEKGVKREVSFVPIGLYYYKFKDGKLTEIGFGNGFDGENPMLN